HRPGCRARAVRPRPNLHPLGRRNGAAAVEQTVAARKEVRGNSAQRETEESFFEGDFHACVGARWDWVHPTFFGRLLLEQTGQDPRQVANDRRETAWSQ